MELPAEGGAPYEELLHAVQGMPQAQQRPAADRVFLAMQRDGRLQGLGTCRPKAWLGLIRHYGRCAGLGIGLYDSSLQTCTCNLKPGLCGQQVLLLICKMPK